MERGKFISLESIDGGGKGTQAKILVQRLYGSGKDDAGNANHVLLTRESMIPRR